MPLTKHHEHLAHFDIKLDGANGGREFEDSLIECTVENSLHLPDMCTFRLDVHEQHHIKWLDADQLKAGTEIKVNAFYEDEAPTTIFLGEIVGVDMDLSAIGPVTILVRCYDYSHRLHRGRKRKSYLQVKDSDIASQIASENGLSADCDSTSGVHEYVYQNNQTDWEFLKARADLNGFRAYVGADAKKLHFKKASDQAAEIALTFGDNLRSFRPRINAASQVDQVVVRGWDPKTKQALVGTHSSTPDGVPQLNGYKPGWEVGKTAFGSAKMVVTDRPVHTQEEAQEMARAIAEEIGGEFVEADGLTYGAPKLMAGSKVEIQNVGTRFSGTYFVTSTTHTLSASEGYTTLFSISGKRPATVLSALEGDGPTARAEMGGNIVIGLVTNNKDPENMGRVKVTYDWQDDNQESTWARQVSPMAGNGRGFYCLPEVNDEVLIAFEHGDPRRPFMLGGVWNGKDALIENQDAAVNGSGVIHRIYKSRIGHTMLIDDENDKGEIKFTTKHGHVVTLNDKDNNIRAETKDGHKVLLDEAGNKIVVVDQNGNHITIDTGSNSITMECKKDFTVKATGKVTIEGQTGIEMKTPAQFSAEGSAGMKMSTSAQMDLEASAQMSINGGAMTNIKGGMVNIN